MAVERPHLELVTSHGRTVRAAYWPARVQSGRTPLLFFNGIGANLEIVAPLADALDDRGFLTFDMPGIGGSPPPVAPYRPWMMARVAARILERFAVSNVDVLGVSWGGGMAQQFALQYAKRVRRLVLAATSTGHLMVPGDVRALSRMASPRRYFDPHYMRQHFETLYGDHSGENSHLHRITPPTRIGYAYQLAAMLGWTSAPFLPFVRAPTLVIMGERDPIVPLINGRILTRLLPNARLEIIKDAGHLFLVTRAAQSVRLMRDFLDHPSTAQNRQAA